MIHVEQYTQSSNIAEIKAKHPFPWREQRNPPFVRLVDANGVEVEMFEITALCRIVTLSVASSDIQSPVTDAKP